MAAIVRGSVGVGRSWQICFVLLLQEAHGLDDFLLVLKLSSELLLFFTDVLLLEGIESDLLELALVSGKLLSSLQKDNTVADNIILTPNQFFIW